MRRPSAAPPAAPRAGADALLLAAPTLTASAASVAGLVAALAFVANVQAGGVAAAPAAAAEVPAAAASGAGGTDPAATPAADAAAGDAAAAQALQWHYGWRMWHGLEIAASKRTGIESSVDALPILNLKEVKVAGTIGGRIEVDASGYHTNGSLAGFDSGVGLRRARLTAKGSSILGVGYDYRVDLGYVTGKFTVTQAYVEVPGVRYLGTVAVGQLTPPVGLQLIRSSWDIAFMEPAAPLQAIAPPSQPGVQASDTFLGGRGTWALGLFAGVGGGDYGSGAKRFGNLMGRATWLAVDAADSEDPRARRYLHLGASANLQQGANGELRYRSRPESFLAPYAIDTGAIEATRAATLGAELLWADGPLSAQAELIASRIDARAGGALHFAGAYALTSLVLTGESRPYNRSAGVPGRLVPRRNFGFGPHAGWGALEAAARVSYTDLSDGAVHGGRLAMLMSSLNWYLRPQLKLMLELGGGRVSGAATGNGSFLIGQLRLGVYFY